MKQVAALELLPAHPLLPTYRAQAELTQLALLICSVGHHALRNIKIPWGPDFWDLIQNKLLEIT